MRKIFLGLLALVLSALSTQLMAGQFEACEEQKETWQELGIYGLCNAWHNADTEEDRVTIEINVEKKIGIPAPWIARCPCFSVDDLALADGYPLANQLILPNVVSATFGSDEQGFLIYAAFSASDGSSGSCFLGNSTQDPLPVPVPYIGLSDPVQVQECLDSVKGLLLEDL